MSGGDHAGTSCPSCGAKYRWKPELASRKIHCAKCGDTIRMPTEAGGKATLVRKADAPAAQSIPKTSPPPPAPPAPRPSAAPQEDLPVLSLETNPPADAPAPDAQIPLEGLDIATSDAPDADPGAPDAPSAPPEEDLNLAGAADADANIYDLAGDDEVATAPPAPPAPPARPPPPAPKGTPAKAPPPGKAAKSTASKADEPPSCPSCKNPLKPGAVICLNCGFNIAAGSKIKTEVVESDDADDSKPGVLSRIKGLLARRAKPAKGKGKD